jgi:hypothetical protein
VNCWERFDYDFTVKRRASPVLTASVELPSDQRLTARVMQNTSHAVMAQRAEPKDSLDDFPTPLWATRALIEYVIVSKTSLGALRCLEPACGRGHMAIVLADHFKEVVPYDVFGYGFGRVADFLKTKHPDHSFDWVITNPPFRLGEEFITRSRRIARRGVAMLTRTVFIESVGRYERLFSSHNSLSAFRWSKVALTKKHLQRRDMRGYYGRETDLVIPN